MKFLAFISAPMVVRDEQGKFEEIRYLEAQNIEEADRIILAYKGQYLDESYSFFILPMDELDDFNSCLVTASFKRFELTYTNPI